MATSIEKFKAVIVAKPSGWDNSFRVPTIPKMSESVADKKGKDEFLAGVESHDQNMEKWRTQLERSISDRIAQVTTTAPAAATTVTQTTPSSPVTSVNGQTGAVQLSSDDVPQGSVNLYLTQAAWIDLFEANGFRSNNIPVTETLLLPGGHHWVCTGPLTIGGTLVIAGYFAAI